MEAKNIVPSIKLHRKLGYSPIVGLRPQGCGGGYFLGGGNGSSVVQGGDRLKTIAPTTGVKVFLLIRLISCVLLRGFYKNLNPPGRHLDGLHKAFSCTLIRS